MEEEGLRIQSDLEDDRFVNPFASDSRRFTIEPQGDAFQQRGVPPTWGEGVAPTGRLSISSRFFAFSGRVPPTMTTERPQPHQLRREIVPGRTRPTALASMAATRQVPPNTSEILLHPLPQPVSPKRTHISESSDAPPPSPPSPAGESGTEEEDVVEGSDFLESPLDGESEVLEADEARVEDGTCDSQWDAETCRRAMEGLRQLLEINLQLYTTTKHRLTMSENSDAEEGLVREFDRVFSLVQSRVGDVLGTPSHMAAPLEKYSQLLLQLVQAKMEAGNEAS